MKRTTKRPAAAPAPAEKRGVSYAALSLFGADKPATVSYAVKPPVLMAGVLPAGAVAMDSASVYEYASLHYAGQGFAGYPHLATLTQISEYRSPSETTANEMTRKWIKIASKGDGDLSKKIEVIEAELKRHKVRELFRLAAEHDGFFGRAQIYVSIKDTSDEARTNPLVIDPRTVKKGSLLGFKAVEAIWTTPAAYNSNDPLAPDFYKPTAWFILGKQTHASRLLTLVSRPVPDMLKPAFNFGGISMSQLMEPYVNAWLRTRQSVSDLLHSFSITGIKTNMGDTLSGGTGSDLFARAKLFNQMRDNRNLMVLDKETEDLFQVNAPLSSLDKLQAQSQEHMAAPSHMPLVKLLGITPTGLGASTDGEMDCWYDFVASMQANLFTEPLKTVIDLIQLDQFGEIDDAITFEFEPLKQMNGTELAAIRKSDCDADIAYITAGVVSTEESRTRLANDPASGYMSLVAEELPEQTDPDTPQGPLDETNSPNSKADPA